MPILYIVKCADVTNGIPLSTKHILHVICWHHCNQAIQIPKLQFMMGRGIVLQPIPAMNFIKAWLIEHVVTVQLRNVLKRSVGCRPVQSSLCFEEWPRRHINWRCPRVQTGGVYRLPIIFNLLYPAGLSHVYYTKIIEYATFTLEFASHNHLLSRWENETEYLIKVADYD